MAINFVSMKCPECGATLPVEGERSISYCSYCGTKIFMNDENEHTYRHIDEARLKQAETDQLVRLKQLDLLEIKRATYEKSRRNTRIISIISAVTGIALIIIGVFLVNASGNPDSPYYILIMMGLLLLISPLFGFIKETKQEDEDYYFEGKIRLPISISDYENKNYVAIETNLRISGFLNIKAVPLNDLRIGFLKKPGLVESIAIDGQETISFNDKYYPDVPIVIFYHSMPS